MTYLIELHPPCKSIGKIHHLMARHDGILIEILLRQILRYPRHIRQLVVRFSDRQSVF